MSGSARAVPWVLAAAVLVAAIHEPALPSQAPTFDPPPEEPPEVLRAEAACEPLESQVESQGESAAPDEAPFLSEPRREPWRVRIVDDAGVPIGGVTLYGGLSGSTPDATTGADGLADLHEAGLFEFPDGTRGFPVVTGGTVPCQGFHLTEPYSEKRVLRGLPIEIRLVDAATGEAVRAAGEISVGFGEQLRAGETRRGCSGRSGVYSLPDSPFARGRVNPAVRAELPRSLAIEGGRRGFSVVGAISEWTKSLRVVVPVRRAATLRVRVAEEDGRPAAGVEVREVLLGRWSQRQAFLAETSGLDGSIELDGVPDLPGELVAVRLDRERASWFVDPARLPGDGSARTLEARPGAYREPCGEVPRCGRDFRVPTPGTSRLRGLVVRRDRSPVPGVHLTMFGAGPVRAHGWEEDSHQEGSWELEGRTASDGSFEFEHVPAGTVAIVADACGMVQIRREVTLAAGEEIELELREPEGRTVTVRVVDPRGAPLPFASLEVRQEGAADWADLVDGVQTLGILTHLEGVRVLRDLSHVPVAVTARFGSRSASATAAVDADAVEIVVPDAVIEDEPEPE